MTLAWRREGRWEWRSLKNTALQGRGDFWKTKITRDPAYQLAPNISIQWYRAMLKRTKHPFYNFRCMCCSLKTERCLVWCFVVAPENRQTIATSPSRQRDWWSSATPKPIPAPAGTKFQNHWSNDSPGGEYERTGMHTMGQIQKLHKP